MREGMRKNVKQDIVDLKKDICFNSRAELTIGVCLLKQRGCRLNLFNSYF